MKKAIIVFTRVPLPGQTKTRLMPVYTKEECVALHMAFLKDVLRECRRTDADIFLYYTPEGEEKALRALLNYEGIMYPQKGNDLGEKMFNAFKEVLGKGYGSALLIGSDLPELGRKHLEEAFKKLESADVVLGPTVDGGYYLIGMKQPLWEAFKKQAYGEGSVFSNTLRAVRDSGHTTDHVEEISDVDTPEDLLCFREKMTEDSRLKESFTGQYLTDHPKISVVIPLYNEKSTIENTLEELEKLEGCEILFVDGGSKDGTLDIIGSKYPVIHSPKGRGNQLNQGAIESHGDVLFFLHCDSRLPENPVKEMADVLKRYHLGCFGIRFRPSNPLLYFCQLMSNQRVKRRKIIFGDQGMFIDRKLFFQKGMFPDLPLMEDYQFSLTLKEENEPVGMTKSRLITSSRRFQGQTLKVMVGMKQLQRMYRKGVPMEEIIKKYQDIR